MKPVFQKITSEPEGGFQVKVVDGHSFNCPWHCHNEYELILVQQSGGYRMLGDHLEPLRPGDLVLVGPQLPHIYQNDEVASGRVPHVRAVLVQFEAAILGSEFIELPALEPVRRLLRRAQLGLHVGGPTCAEVSQMMLELVEASGLQQIIRFLSILDVLAHSRDCQSLATAGFVAERNMFDQQRMDRVCQYIHERFDQPITLGEVARLVHLSEGAFSRFFRTHAGKTFPQFVNELRVGRACRLLVEDELNVTEIAYTCGFRNLSNFNRQFQRLKQTAPREYRRSVRNHALKEVG